MKIDPTRKDHGLTLLIDRVSQGDVEAFTQVYSLFCPKLLRYGNIILPEPPVVDDLVQDLFIWILENPQRIAQVDNFEVYLFHSLKKNLIRYIKRDGRSREINRMLWATNFQEYVQETVEESMIEAERHAINRNWLREQLDSLPACQKEVVYLRYYEGLSYDEIAEIISKSNQVARNYANRALKRLRKEHDAKI